MQPLAATIETLRVQHAVHRIGARTLVVFSLTEGLSERDRIGMAALETRSMPGGERRRFVEKNSSV